MGTLFSTATLLLTLALSFLISSNNLSVCIGPIISARLLTSREATVLAIIGFTFGLLVEGHRMSFVQLPPDRTVIVLSVTLIVVLLGELLRVPISLMYVLSTGLSTMYMFNHNMRPPHTFILSVLYWLGSALLVVIASPITLRLFQRIGSSRPFRFVTIYRIVSVLTTFLLCVSFGANNLGLLWSISGHSLAIVPGIILAMLLGVLLTGKRTLEKLAGMYVLSPTACLTITSVTFAASQIATLLRIPVSFSVLLVCSLVGVSLAYHIRLIDFKYAYRSLTVLFASIPLTMLTLSILEALTHVLIS